MAGAGEVWAVEDGRLRQMAARDRPGSAGSAPSSWRSSSLDGPAGRSRPGSHPPEVPGRAALPTVMQIHGGPTGAGGPGGTLDAIALCAAGYRVLIPNIRGSATFGGRGFAASRPHGAAPTRRMRWPRSTARGRGGLPIRSGSASWAVVRRLPDAVAGRRHRPIRGWRPPRTASPTRPRMGELVLRRPLQPSGRPG